MLARLPLAGANSKPHHCKQKIQKPRDLSKTWVLTGKQFEDFGRKEEQKQNSRPFKNTQRNTRPLNATIEQGSCNPAEISRRKNKKSFQIETVGTLQD